MRELCLACMGAVLETAVFFSFGSLLMKVMKMKEEASVALILGYLLYMGIFELIAVPATLLRVPLTTLSYVWAVFMVTAVLAGTVLCGRTWLCQIHNIPEVFRSHSVMILAAGAVIFLQCLAVVLYMDNTADAAYYVGTVGTSVYTDTLARYDPLTGNPQKNFQVRYILSAYPMHNAVWCRLTGMHALVQAKVVMSALNVFISNLVIYQIGKRLFEGGIKQADLMVILVCVLQLFTNTIYTTGTFFFTRSYEGKALLGNLAIPMVLFCAIWFWQEKDSRNIWIVLFLSSLSAVAFSGSAIIFPVVISAGFLPMILLRKQFFRLLPYMVCLLPCVVYSVVYFAVKMKLLTFKAW